MSNIYEQVENYGIVPVVKLDRVEDAVPLGKALVKGGLPVAEVTFRTACAEEAIKAMSKNIPEMLVGAGTVLTIDQVKQAVGAGSKFIVSPGFNPKVVEYCVKNNIPVFPGANIPSVMEAAMEMGLKVVKFFPAEESGGASYIKAVSAPYSGLKFIPTGGVNLTNLNNYLSLSNVIACGGTWMVKPDMIAAGKYDEIEKITREAIQLMLGFEFSHLGINEENEKSAKSSADTFAKFFNFKVNDGSSSIFTGPNAKEIEIMKKPYLGKKGHLSIGTNNINRALFYLGQMGLKELKDTRKEKDGKLKAVYMDMDISGFAVHLMQK